MLQQFEFNGKTIRMAKTDKGVIWVCLTDMASASNKQVKHWNENKTTKEFLDALNAEVGYPTTRTIKGGVPEKQGTWGIQEVGIKFAAWCSVSFEIWMLDKMKTLMNEGTVSLNKPKLPQNYLEALKCLVVAEEEKLLLQSQVEEQKLLIESKEQTIDAQQEIIVEWHPLVKNYKQFMDTDGLLSMSEAAKMLSEETGRNKLIKVLRLLGIFIQNPNKREPYQKYMKHFRMKVKVRDSVSTKTGTRKADVVTLFTPEGFNSILRIMINKCDSEEQLMEYLKKPSLLDLKLKKQKAEKDNRLSEVEDNLFSLLD